MSERYIPLEERILDAKSKGIEEIDHFGIRIIVDIEPIKDLIAKANQTNPATIETEIPVEA